MFDTLSKWHYKKGHLSLRSPLPALHYWRWLVQTGFWKPGYRYVPIYLVLAFLAFHTVPCDKPRGGWGNLRSITALQPTFLAGGEHVSAKIWVCFCNKYLAEEFRVECWDGCSHCQSSSEKGGGAWRQCKTADEEDWQDSLGVPHPSGQWHLLTRKCCSCSRMLVKKVGHTSYAKVWRKIWWYVSSCAFSDKSRSQRGLRQKRSTCRLSLGMSWLCSQSLWCMGLFTPPLSS